MGKFNEYTQKATPADNDTLMIYDATSKANKLSPFSGIWNWIVGKLTNAVISNLQTSNRTVLGAINELNSKTPSINVNSLENYMKSAPAGVNFCDCQNADDNPFKGNMSICMTYVNDNHSWGIQYLFVYDHIHYRAMSDGVVGEWISNSNRLMRYDLPDEGSVKIVLPYAKGCYMLSVYHSFAGSNTYILDGFHTGSSVAIYSLHESYSGYTVVSADNNAIVVSQKSTGGGAQVGLLRIV